MRRGVVVALSFLICCVPLVLAQSSSVPASRVGHLRQGVNLSAWFAQVYDPKGYTKEHFENWTTAADIALIKSAGFDHVRLSVNPAPIMEERRHGGSEEMLNALDAAMKMILDAGLAVELDMHPDSDFKARLAKEDDFVERFADFWRMLAKRYAGHDTERVFFEILNEPEMKDAYRWYGVETKLAAAIRQAAPANTILAAGAKWDDDDDMIFLEPLRDPNVIYVFHFYEPHIFTHQGATWGAYYWHWLKDLHYPSDPKNAAEVAASVPEAVHRLDVIRYGQDHWDGARVEAEINQAAEWAKQNGVPLVCNEFGAFRQANPQDRNGWIKDVRTSLERHSIGWAMWDYSDNFGVAIKKDGKAVLDADTVKALGMKMP
ncbi:MAG TPA: cellulase family glycosylhydrolase [Candidatus Dormibacteraeota bacterium]|nr:cellulase family glycosylhydrolase [Candidatus Dormibacteraeota bacterium]